MAEERVQRRLAAILAADVAGYSRLMGVDEEGTLSALKELRRELADPKIKEHRGRIVKTTGDGLLVEFASVVDAVRCAVEVQYCRDEIGSRSPLFAAKSSDCSPRCAGTRCFASPLDVRLSKLIIAAMPNAGPFRPLCQRDIAFASLKSGRAAPISGCKVCY